MFLTTWPSPEFAVFGNFLLWIILPVLTISIAFTMYWHYRGKARVENEEFDDLTTSMGSGNPIIVSRGAYVFFDHSKLVKEYQDKLLFQHARFAALQQDFRRLEKKYIHALNTASLQLSPADCSPQDVEHFYLAEKATLLDRLTELERVYVERVSQNVPIDEPIHNLPTAQV